MRQIINLSLPPQASILLKKRVKQGGFTSVSEYIRTLLELDQDLISKQQLLMMARKADQEYNK